MNLDTQDSPVESEEIDDNGEVPDAPVQAVADREAQRPQADGSRRTLETGRLIGLVGVEQARTNRSRCMVCETAGFPGPVCVIAEQNTRFLFRQYKRSIERSVHGACVYSLSLLPFCSTRDHVRNSIMFLEDASRAASSDSEKIRMLDAADGYRNHLNEPGQTSDMAPPSASASASASSAPALS